MIDKPSKPGTVYVVSKLEDGRWREVLSTEHEPSARARLAKLGDKGRLE